MEASEAGLELAEERVPLQEQARLMAQKQTQHTENYSQKENRCGKCSGNSVINSRRPRPGRSSWTIATPSQGGASSQEVSGPQFPAWWNPEAAGLAQPRLTKLLYHDENFPSFFLYIIFYYLPPCSLSSGTLISCILGKTKLSHCSLMPCWLFFSSKVYSGWFRLLCSNFLESFSATPYLLFIPLCVFLILGIVLFNSTNLSIFLVTAMPPFSFEYMEYCYEHDFYGSFS